MMDIRELKQKLRDLKKIEKNVRKKAFISDEEKHLVWNQFFSTKNENDISVKYCMNILLHMDDDRRGEAFQEYFYGLYYNVYKESGIDIENTLDPKLLSIMGLSINSDITHVKKKFRELAKRYHPDHGGDEKLMIELLDTYNELMKKY